MSAASDVGAFMSALGDVEYGPAACWPWPSYRNPPPEDYVGKIVDGQFVAHHVTSFVLFVGPIPDGCEIDHVRERGCVTKRCANPAHLDAVTHSENIKRSAAATRRRRREARSIVLLLLGAR